MAFGRNTAKMKASRALGIVKDAVREKLAANQSNMSPEDVADHYAVAKDLVEAYHDALLDERDDATAAASAAVSADAKPDPRDGADPDDPILAGTLDEQDDSGGSEDSGNSRDGSPGPGGR